MKFEKIKYNLFVKKDLPPKVKKSRLDALEEELAQLESGNEDTENKAIVSQPTLSNRNGSSFFNKIDFPPEMLQYFHNYDNTELQIRDNELWIITRSSGKIRANITIDEKTHYKLIRQAANFAGKNFNSSDPILDTEYFDEATNLSLRINATDKTIGNGAYYSAYRNISVGQRITINDLLQTGYMPPEVALLLSCLIKAKRNIVIVGETNSGKTQLIKIFAEYIPGAIATIEDTPELSLKTLLPDRNILSFKAGQFASYESLIKACLRQNPEAILLAEARGEEVRDLINAASSGHQIITTVHAREADLVPGRLKTMAKGDDLFEETIYENLDFAIMLKMRTIGDKVKRELVEIVEFVYDETEDEKCTINGIYTKKFLSTDRFFYARGTIKGSAVLQSLIDTKEDGISLYDKLAKETRYVD